MSRQTYITVCVGGLCFSVQDKAQPETQARTFGSVSFNALLAVDDPRAMPLVVQPGSDGFRVDSAPLFQVCSALAFFLNVPFSVIRREFFPVLY